MARSYSQHSPAVPLRRQIDSLMSLLKALDPRDPATAFVALLSVYCLVHLAIRAVLPAAVTLDEAEQLLLTQSWSWGYGIQPPLYTWLQRLFFDAFGVNVFSLTLLKSLILFGAYLFTFLSARAMLGNAHLALLASFSLWLIPEIGWESHRERTHSLLATTLSAATFYTMLKVVQSGAIRHYVALGVLLALGMLSKYTFLIFVPALLAGVVSSGTFRSSLLNRRALVTLGVAAVMLLPHLLWVGGHLHPATSQTLEKLRIGTGAPTLDGIVTGLLSLTRAGVGFLAPFALIHVVLFPRAYTDRVALSAPANDYRRLLERLFIAVAALLAVMVVAFGVTRFRVRWMEPLLFLVPSYLFLRVQGSRIDPRKIRVFAYVLAFFALLVIPLRLSAVWVAPAFGKYARVHLPVAELTRQIRAAGFTTGTIVAEDGWIGGNLRLHFKDSAVLTPAVSDDVPEPRANASRYLIVWNASRGRTLPAAMKQFLTERVGLSVSSPLTPRYTAAALDRPEAIYQLAFALVRKPR
jgi:4-amino-4-deoxy-L-arabinose transferase-like glycosyltransferase